MRLDIFAALRLDSPAAEDICGLTSGKHLPRTKSRQEAYLELCAVGRSIARNVFLFQRVLHHRRSDGWGLNSRLKGRRRHNGKNQAEK